MLHIGQVRWWEAITVRFGRWERCHGKWESISKAFSEMTCVGRLDHGSVAVRIIDERFAPSNRRSIWSAPRLASAWARIVRNKLCNSVCSGRAGTSNSQVQQILRWNTANHVTSISRSKVDYFKWLRIKYIKLNIYIPNLICDHPPSGVVYTRSFGRVCLSVCLHVCLEGILVKTFRSVTNAIRRLDISAIFFAPSTNIITYLCHGNNAEYFICLCICLIVCLFVSPTLSLPFFRWNKDI